MGTVDLAPGVDKLEIIEAIHKTRLNGYNVSVAPVRHTGDGSRWKW